MFRPGALPLLLVLIALPAVAQAPRPGAELRFATLGSSGGMQGTAFLPIAPSDVRPAPRTPGCTVARFDVRARGLRGLIRELKLSLPDVSSPGEVQIGAGCDQATVTAKLDDGTEVEGTGSVRVTALPRGGSIKLELDLTWSPRVRGQVLPMTGHIVVPAPPAP